MSERYQTEGLVGRILGVHEMLSSMRVRHQFGGAIALAWYRNPRATTDIDVNITVRPEHADPILSALQHLGVTVSQDDGDAIRADGQARLEWGDSFLDLFFATLPLHVEMAERAQVVSFSLSEIPILSAEDLVICKSIFDRPRDWVDIDAMIAWGTKIDETIVNRWLSDLLGESSPAQQRLGALLRRDA